jgi:hypothetical protein
VGRHFLLNDVMGPEMKDADGAGFVISRLMKVADVAGLEPASMAILEGNDGTVESSLVTKFFDEKLPGMTKPEVLTTQGPVLLLQQKEEVAHQTDNDEFYLLDDPKVRCLKRWNIKWKKSSRLRKAVN